MSSQAERIRAFKLAQHARLQKQDEEEQWISSEELCTEGSSDEETHTTCVKTHRKPKRNAKTEKRGISPLAQPPRIPETESTSTYQRDSKFLSPETCTPEKGTEEQSASGGGQPEMHDLIADIKMRGIDTKVEKLDLGSSSSKAHSSKYVDSREGSVESDVDQEIEKLIQWRPKRGSIKLPEFPEDRPETLEHIIFQENAFHTEMVTKMHLLELQSRRRKAVAHLANINLPPDPGEVNLAPEGNKDEPTNNDFWQIIAELDSLISDKDNLYQTLKQERKLVQDEMCNVIKKSEVTPSHSKSSQIFLHLCNFETSSEEAENEDNCVEEQNEDNNANNKSSDASVKKKKKSAKPDKDFVSRNIELAKQHSMAQFSLTDEEKIKLESLLSNLDSEEYAADFVKAENTQMSCAKNPTKKDGEDDENKEDLPNQFKLNEDDLTDLRDLEIKLNDLLESYDQNDIPRKLNQAFANAEAEDELETADKEGRYWKHHHLQKRLESIEKSLADIAIKDAEEQKKMEEDKQECAEENDSSLDEESSDESEN